MVLKETAHDAYLLKKLGDKQAGCSEEEKKRFWRMSCE